MRTIINLFLFSFMGIVAGLAAISSIGENATDSVKRDNVEVVYGNDYDAATAVKVAETLASKPIFGGEPKQISVQLDREQGRHQIWLGYELDAQNAGFTAAIYEVIASVVSAHCFAGQPLEFVLCETYGDPILTVPAHPKLRRLIYLGDDIVFYGDGMTQTEAEALAQGLKDVSYLDDRGGTVRLSKTDDGFLMQSLVTAEEANEKDLESLKRDILLLRRSVFCGASVRWQFFQDIDEPFERLSLSVPSVGYAPIEYSTDLITLDHGPELDDATRDRIIAQFSAIRTNPIWLRLVGEQNAFTLQYPEENVEVTEQLKDVVELMGRQVRNELPEDATLNAEICDLNLSCHFSLPITSSAGSPVKVGSNVIFSGEETTEEGVSRLFHALEEFEFISEESCAMIWLTEQGDSTVVQISFPPDQINAETTATFQSMKTFLGHGIYQGREFRLLVGGLCGGLEDAVEIDVPSGEGDLTN